MARGWESKSVEQQQAEMSDQPKTDRPAVSPERARARPEAPGIGPLPQVASATTRACEPPAASPDAGAGDRRPGSTTVVVLVVYSPCQPSHPGGLYTRYKENRGRERARLTYNEAGHEGLRLRLSEEERFGSAG